ncbi:MAG: YdcF family protein [Chitinophagaceae bacterium]|nr:MAG: YdcF family protein [Chitinophagaceae bacterium]
MLVRDFLKCVYRTVLTTSAIALLSSTAFSQQPAPDPKYKLVAGSGFVQSKNYYFLTLLTQLQDVREFLGKDTALAGLRIRKNEILQSSVTTCGRDGSCLIGKLKFSPEEIRLVSERLTALYLPGNVLGKLVANHIAPSGTYVLYQELPAKEQLVKAWEQDANGINWAIDVYAGGKKPNYPNIDSISVNTKDAGGTYRAGYVSFLQSAATVITEETKTSSDFFAVPLTASLLFIEGNEREQAADYEPMEKGQNKAAFDKIKTTKFDTYKYSVILIPGAGPEDPGEALSAEGMLRCRLGALQYKAGLAPFIIPSGGKVHPYKTKYNEAIEMKKYLIEKLGIPEYAIIIEPHARHTTTNMRNAARLMFRYGIPFSKAGLTITTKLQSNMIGGSLVERCRKELNGAVPYKPGKRHSETTIEFYPLIAALQLDPDEPMDP